jgi:hypothetical protein
MSASATYMAATAPDGEVINVLMGILTFYLVTTSWLTARRRSGGTGVLEQVAPLVALGVGAGLAYYGLQASNSESGTLSGVSAVVYFVFCGVALLAAALDLRMILQGGVLGGQRVARHLWRMCAALFIAATSLFLGQQQVFPVAVRNSGLLPVPGLVVLGLLVFWLVRVLFTRAFTRVALPPVRLASG